VTGTGKDHNKVLIDTNTVVAVGSFGFNGNCKGADYSARVDVPDAQDFILPFVGD